MDQDKNLQEDGQTNVITRSTARHLRRKRLNEARRARNQFLDDFINGVDEKINQETEVNSDSEKSKLTKSKARRLRKKEKAKLLECCCCDTSVVSTNFLHLEPNCCIKSNQNTFNSHLNNVQHIEDFFTQSLLSLGNHKKTIRKSEDTIECEYNYNKQDINSSRSYLTKLVNFDSEDLSDSSQIVIFSGLPKSINKEEQTHCTKNSSGIKRSYLESCNIKVVQSSDTSFPVSDNSSRPNYLFIPNSIYKDHQEENKNISLNDQTLENIVRSETCPLKYEEDNYSPLVIQEISEEPSNIEKTSQDSIVQREPLEESKELILPVNATLDNLVSTKNEQSNKIMDSKASGTVKTREEIKAEREARKAAKVANKGKGKVVANTSDKQNIPIKVDNISNDNEKQKTNNVIISESNDMSVTENNSNNTMTEDSTVNIKSEGKSNAILLEKNNKSSLVVQNSSEESSDIEKTLQVSVVQREPLEESTELILPVSSTLDISVPTKNEQSNKIMDSKASGMVKTKEEIKAEREARKAAKAANKGKGKVAANTSDKQNIPIKVDNISNDNEKQKTNNVIISESNDMSVTENNSNNTMTEDSSVNIKSEGKSNAILLEKNNKSSLVVQNSSEESSDIEKTSQVSVVQREPLEESTELILPVSSTLDISVPTKNEQSNKIMDSKASGMVKTKEEIKAEREARKAAKAANKGKGKVAANTSDKQNISIKVDNISNDNEKQKTNNVIISESNDMSVTENNSNNTMTEDSIVNIKSEGKSKAELRAERRAKQEAQRAAKQEAQRTAKQEQVGEKMKVKSKPNMIQPKTIVTATADHPVDNKTNKIIKKTTKNDTHEVNLFKHLYHERELALDKVSTSNFNIHPAIQKLGVQYENKIIVGSNARCVAFLVAIKQLIGDFDKPLKTDFTRGLETKLQESVSYLHACRPLAVSMQNALRHLKWQMTQLDSTSSDADAKHKLRSLIDTYIVEQIHLADESISIFIQTKISNGNVILTYGYSSLIEKILTDAHKAGKQFRVIIVDGRPWLEGKEQLRRLATYGIDCSYVLINALSFVMPEVSKVFLGAHAILANGAVMSRIGTAQVALMAKSFNVPVLVACETHKSCERVQTDSIVHNELGNVDDLTKSTYRNSNKSLLYNWRSKKYLNLLNITYDVTPADLVTAVVTELAILPCTSVPVILRIKPSEI